MMKTLRFAELPWVARILLALAAYNFWWSFEEFVIDRFGFWRYLPDYAFGRFCVWDVAACFLISTTVAWLSTRRQFGAD